MMITWLATITTLEQYEIPAESIPNCALSDDGKKILCDGYRILDARANIRTEAPDVIQKVRILAISQASPERHPVLQPRIPG